MIEYRAAGEVLIYHDLRRPNGYWYATVPIYEVQRDSQFTKVHKSTRIRDLEVILNGGGLSKARKKIYRQLNSFGININWSDFTIKHTP